MSIFAQDLIRRLLDLHETNREGWCLRITESPEGQEFNKQLAAVEDPVSIQEARAYPRDEDAIYSRRNRFNVGYVNWGDSFGDRPGSTTVELIRSGFVVDDNSVAMPCDRHEGRELSFILDGYAAELSDECEFRSPLFKTLNGKRNGCRWWLTMATLLAAPRMAHGFVDDITGWDRKFSIEETSECGTAVICSVAPFSEEVPPYPCVTIIRHFFRSMARAIDILVRTETSHGSTSRISSSPSPVVAANPPKGKRQVVAARRQRLKELYEDHKSEILSSSRKLALLAEMANADGVIASLNILVTTDDVKNDMKHIKLSRKKAGKSGR